MASVPNMRLGPTARPGVAEQPGEGGEGEDFARLLCGTVPAKGGTVDLPKETATSNEDRPATGGESETPIAQADAILSLVAFQPAPTPAAPVGDLGEAAPVSSAAIAPAGPGAGTPNATPAVPAAAGIVTVPAATLDAPISAAEPLATTSGPTEAEAKTAPAGAPALKGAGAPVLTGPAVQAAPSDGQPAQDPVTVRFAGAAPAAPAIAPTAATTPSAAAPSAPTASAKTAAAPIVPTAPPLAGGEAVVAAQPGRIVRRTAAKAQPIAGQGNARVDPDVAAAAGPSAHAVTQGLRESVRQASSLVQPKGETAAQAPAQTPVQSGSPTVPSFVSTIATELATTSQPAAASAPAASAAALEPMVERQLELAADGEWLDRLARDIASAGSAEGKMRFRLDPEHLGTLRVELAQGDRGTSVRLTVESEAARAIIAEAQPKLIAEARAQGVRIAETHVDLAGGQAGDSRRHEAERREPQLRTAREPSSEAEPERGTRSSSDRYA